MVAGAVLDLGQARAPLPRLARRPRDQHDRPRAVGQRPGVVRARRRRDDRGGAAPGRAPGRHRRHRARQRAARAQRPDARAARPRRHPRAASSWSRRSSRSGCTRSTARCAHDVRADAEARPGHLPLRGRRARRLALHRRRPALRRPGRPAGGRDGARPRRHQGLRPRAVRRRRWPRPGSTCSPSTTAASAPAGRYAAPAGRMAGQLEDYRAAMAAAARLPGVDPQRLVLWGVSLSGGHVLAAAAGRDDVAAVVSLTPLVDGRAAAVLALASHPPPRCSARPRPACAAASLRRGREPVMMPIVPAPARSARSRCPATTRPTSPSPARPGATRSTPSVGLELGGHRPAQARQAAALPAARPDRRLRPLRPAARLRQGRRGRPRRGPPLPLRPLRRLARQRLVRGRGVATRWRSCAAR